VVAELLATGRMPGVPRLLSPGELGALLTLLDRLPPATAARLPSVVRAALPLAELPGALLAGADWGSPDAAARTARVRSLVDYLKGLRGDNRPIPDGTSGVPGLLRVITYVTALGPPAGGADS
jgi:hypothetical protein